MADKKYPDYGNHFSWSEDWKIEKGEFFDAPSMVEPVHNLTLEEIVRDYSRGILHPSRTPLYDEGDDITEVELFEDFVDVYDSPVPTEIRDSHEVKTPPAATLETSELPPMADDSSPEQ